MLVHLTLGGRLWYYAYFRSSDVRSVVAPFAYVLLLFLPFAFSLSTLVFLLVSPVSLGSVCVSCCGISTRPYGMFVTRIVLPRMDPR